jgi:hypothetical protein
MLEPFVERPHAHCADALGDQIPDWILDQGCGDPRPHLETVGEVRGAIELAAADVDGTMRRLAERHDTRVETMDQRTERQKVQCGVRANVEPVSHAVECSCIRQAGSAAHSV